MLETEHGQAELFEVVALQLPRRLAAACTAGSNSAIRMAMIVMTTKSSTSVNALLVPTLRVGRTLRTLRVRCQAHAALRPVCSHAEHVNKAVSDF